MKTEDTHTLVQNEYTEQSPVYSLESKTPAVSEGRLQSPKFFGCCEARIGWTIWYSLKCFFVVFGTIMVEQKYWASLDELVYSKNMTVNQEDDFRKRVSLAFWLLNIKNCVLLICFGLLMFGIHGKRQNRHDFFYPMILNEWVSLLFWMSWSAAVSDLHEHDAVIFIPGLICMIFPYYLNIFRVHVKEVTKYSSFV